MISCEKIQQPKRWQEMEVHLAPENEHLEQERSTSIEKKK
jgi:hypothetical protein